MKKFSEVKVNQSDGSWITYAGKVYVSIESGGALIIIHDDGINPTKEIGRPEHCWRFYEGKQ